VNEPTPPTPTLAFHGGLAGALAPFALFLGGVAWLGLSGAPDESGFWPVLLASLMLGLILCRDPSRYADAMLDGMSRRLVLLMVMAWLLAGVFGVLLRESGLIDSLVWAARSAGVAGGGYAAAAFVVAAVFSTATGTSLGTVLVCAPLLYPIGSLVGTDPAFLIGAILGGATFGDNVSPVSDTTIASAATQGADLGGVVRSRMRYALPAAAVSLVVFAAFGGVAGGAGGGPAVAGAGPAGGAIGPGGFASAAPGLVMLLAPALVLFLLLRRRHLVQGLTYGILAAAGLGLLLGRFAPSDLLSIDHENFVAQGLVLDGMRRAVGVSVFTILVMGLVGGLEAAGVVDRLLAWIRLRSASAGRAEWWIFGSVTGATVLTTHSTVAIIAVGDLAKEVGEGAGVGAYRRANILDVVVCTYPFLLPFFIPVILAASMTAGVEGMPRVSPWDTGLHNVHSWALLAVIVFAIGTGWGRTKG
jgi:Na+/H+ antiporter NhaC